MIVRHVTSIRDVLTVLHDPEIQTKNPERFDDINEVPEGIYIGCYLDYKIISLFIAIDGKGHFYCLKPYRKFARECFLESMKLSPPVYFEVESKSLENFGKKLGFHKSGNRMVKEWAI